MGEFSTTLTIGHDKKIQRDITYIRMKVHRDELNNNLNRLF